MTAGEPRRFHPRRAVFTILVIGVLVGITTWRDRQPKLWAWSGAAMGTNYTVKFVAARINHSVADLLRRDIEHELQNIEAERTNGDSQAADRLTSLLEAHGLSNTFVVVGGAARSRGVSQDGTTWPPGT
jgi:hypothetical protein